MQTKPIFHTVFIHMENELIKLLSSFNANEWLFSMSGSKSF